MNYKVSVLVSIHNSEYFIERCARSLFNQTYTNLVFIFVDDCSTDCSISDLERVIKEYPERENTVKIIRHMSTGGWRHVNDTKYNTDPVRSSSEIEKAFEVILPDKSTFEKTV